MSLSLCWESYRWDRVDEWLEQARMDEGKPKQEESDGEGGRDYPLQEPILDC